MVLRGYTVSKQMRYYVLNNTLMNMNIFQKNWPFSNEYIFCVLLLLSYNHCLSPDFFARFIAFLFFYFLYSYSSISCYPKR